MSIDINTTEITLESLKLRYAKGSGTLKEEVTKEFERDPLLYLCDIMATNHKEAVKVWTVPASIRLGRWSRVIVVETVRRHFEEIMPEFSANIEYLGVTGTDHYVKVTISGWVE